MTPGPSSLLAALEGQAATLKRRSLVFLFSDFAGVDANGAELVRDASGGARRSDDWSRVLRRLGARHDVIAVRLVDRFEEELPEAGVLRLVRMGDGEMVEVDGRRGAVRDAWRDAATARRAALGEIFRRARVEWIDVDGRRHRGAAGRVLPQARSGPGSPGGRRGVTPLLLVAFQGVTVTSAVRPLDPAVTSPYPIGTELVWEVVVDDPERGGAGDFGVDLDGDGEPDGYDIAWEMLEGDVSTDGRFDYVKAVRLMPLEGGTLSVPPFGVRFSDGEEVLVEPVTVEVRSELLEGEDAPRPAPEFREVEEGTGLGDPRIALAALIALLAVPLMVFAFLRRGAARRAAHRTANSPSRSGWPPSTPPSSRAPRRRRWARWCVSPPSDGRARAGRPRPIRSGRPGSVASRS